MGVFDVSGGGRGLLVLGGGECSKRSKCGMKDCGVWEIRPDIIEDLLRIL